MFVATGFGKWGMTQGTLAGNILCDLILDQEEPVGRGLLAAEESRARRNGPCRSDERRDGLASGLQRAQGEMPHMLAFKCKLVWNRDERSWDCPCHGSRFAEDGSVLDTPAIHGIEPAGDPECK